MADERQTAGIPNVYLHMAMWGAVVGAIYGVASLLLADRSNPFFAYELPILLMGIISFSLPLGAIIGLIQGTVMQEQLRRLPSSFTHNDTDSIELRLIAVAISVPLFLQLSVSAVTGALFAGQIETILLPLLLATIATVLAAVRYIQRLRIYAAHHAYEKAKNRLVDTDDREHTLLQDTSQNTPISATSEK